MTVRILILNWYTLVGSISKALSDIDRREVSQRSTKFATLVDNEKNVRYRLCTPSHA